MQHSIMPPYFCFLYFYIYCFSFIFVVRSLEYSPLVKMEYGTVRGSVMTSSGGRNFYAYRKIPYAAPPVGNLRFQEPQKPRQYEGVLDTIQDSEDCLQPNTEYNSYPLNTSTSATFVGSEDCLYLNVYTPNINPVKPYPVMFHIHGGGFVVGSGSSQLFGPEHFMDKDIVLVSINYRLGLLGFLSLENHILPGNLGLKDQSAALEWAHNNIKYFGGDPSSVTIFGESAGGASVHYQMLSPLSKGLFHRAISQSGNIYCPWALSPSGTSRKLVMDIAEVLQCPKEDSSLLKCLKDISVEKIFEANEEITDHSIPQLLLLRPVLEENSENAFITLESIHNTIPVPWLTGFNSKEGLFLYDRLCQRGDRNFDILNSRLKEYLPKVLYYSEISEKPDDITARIMHFYLGGKSFSAENVEVALEMFGDRLFVFPHMKGVAKHKGDLFCYYYTYRGKRSFSNLHGTSHIDGANHGDDKFSLFHMKKFYPINKYNENDKRISQLLINFWTNFASFGHPSPPQSGLVEWEDYKTNKKCLKISENEILMICAELFPSRMKLWNDLLSSSEAILHTEL